MSGLKSRRKGMRVEYEIRDHLRLCGFEVDRVPASGASQGFKGDLRVKLSDSSELLVEVKARASGFKTIYKYMLNNGVLDEVWSYVTCGPAVISFHPHVILYKITRNTYIACHSTQHRLCAAVSQVKKLLGPCDILVLKADRKPAIYISWHT